MKTSLLLLCLLGGVFSTKVRFDGFEVHRVTPKTEQQVKALKDLEENNIAYDFWSDVTGVNNTVNVMVPPNLKPNFQNFVQNQRLEDAVIIQNVQKLIDDERSVRPQTRSFDWTDYHRLNVIYEWLDQLVATYPSVTRIVGGHSYEGRQIRGVRVSFSPDNFNNAVFFECGIHAREWVSPATCTYILNEILTSNNNTFQRYDWYIFPVFNPDGYEYTHTTDRMWRKTRTPYGTCFGADPNRNWDFQWNTGGASNNPCSNTYAGPRPFSEASTRSMSQYITSIQSRLVAYLNFHSYSQMLLIPYGHTSEQLDNYDELYTIGVKAMESLAALYGTQYRVGNVVDLLYVSSGASTDWVKGVHGTRITYDYELRDTGSYGFILPAEQIIESGRETLESVVRILDEFHNL